mgnify:FL=1
MLKNFLLVALGGATGSMLRYGMSLLIQNRQFPLSTFIINIIGSCIIGAVIAYGIKNEEFNINWKLFLATGICGGFTTFSAFSIENLQLLQSGKYLLTSFYITASVFTGIAAAFLGFKLSQTFLQ